MGGKLPLKYVLRMYAIKLFIPGYSLANISSDVRIIEILAINSRRHCHKCVNDSLELLIAVVWSHNG